MKTRLLQYLDPRARKGIHQRLAVMMTQLGGLSRSVVYREHAQEGKSISAARAYSGEARIALADLITQCRLVAEEEGWDYDVIVTDGEERFIERMEELKRGQI